MTTHVIHFTVIYSVLVPKLIGAVFLSREDPSLDARFVHDSKHNVTKVVSLCINGRKTQKSIHLSYVTLKVPIMTAADDIHCFSEKIRLDISSESSARQRIHMKNQALFSSKDKSKKIKCCLLQFCLAL